MCRERISIVRLCMLAALVLSLSLLQTSWAQQSRGAYTDVPELPEGVIGDRIARLIDVMSSNDVERVRAFVEEELAESFPERH